MRKKNSAFCYLYDSIVAQIAAGRFPYGASLPSASQLCGIYQVGLRTVRDVMPVLQRDGYIRTQERRRPVVVYRPAAPLSGTNFVRTLLERRSSISADFEAMAVLMPPLLRFCAEQCTDEELHAYATASRRVRKAFHADVIESWRLSSSILNSILSKSGNPLFRDLYASLELFTQFSASGEQVHPFQRAKEIEAAQPFHWVLAPLLQRDHPEDERRLQLMYRIIGSYADEYLARLSAEYPDAPVPLAGAYHWDATRGRGFLYGEVAHDLTAKLSAGLWEDGAFLPDAAELAAQYGVSLYTVRRALSLLEGRGMVRVCNGQGTQVTLSQIARNPCCFSDPAQRRDAMAYLQACHLMVLLLPTAAALAFDRLSISDRDRLSRQLSEQGAAVMSSLLECVIAALPSDVLRTIFYELSKLLLWGSYFAMYPAAGDSIPILERHCRLALDLWGCGDRAGFADQLTGFYLYRFRHTQEFLLLEGRQEAGILSSPPSG